VDVPTNSVVDSVPLTGQYSLRYRSSARLVLDADADRLWVLGLVAQAAQLLEFNAGKMLPLHHVVVRAAVQDAAAMDGHLYLATSVGLADLAPGAAGTTLLPAVHGAVSAVAADPVRNRLIVLDASTPGAVVVVSAGRAGTRRTFGDLIKGSIAIVGDEIWVGGYGGGIRGGYRALVARLDPVTLAPVQTSSIALRVDRVDVSPGARDIWVTTGAVGVWCIDAVDGTILERWPSASAPVTSGLGGAYVIDAGLVVPLVLRGCAG